MSKEEIIDWFAKHYPSTESERLAILLSNQIVAAESQLTDLREKVRILEAQSAQIISRAEEYGFTAAANEFREILKSNPVSEEQALREKLRVAEAKADWLDKWLPKIQRLLRSDELEVSSSFDAARELETLPVSEGSGD
jgi:hypothetical protein